MLKKWKIKRALGKAINTLESSTWFITYKIDRFSDLLKVEANGYREAKEKAIRILDDFYGEGEYKILSISCI